MRSKGAIIFWVDVLNGLLFLTLMATGSILIWVLPPGSGGGRGEGFGRGFRGGRGAGQTLWDWTRHEWSDFHFWIAAALVTGILLHVLLHFGWIKTCVPRYLVPPFFRRAKGTAIAH
jgi:hypothetical protein